MTKGFLWWATVIFATAQCQLETVSYFPWDGSFVRIAGRCVDPAFGAAASFNFLFLQVTDIIFELTIFNTVVGYWDADLNPAITISAMLVFYAILNIWRVDWYGEVEFWIGMGKVLLATGLLLYTFITMVGGNPLHWAFGFHYWKHPGAWKGSDTTAQFEAFVQAAVKAGL
jgi:amino acid transporter